MAEANDLPQEPVDDEEDFRETYERLGELYGFLLENEEEHWMQEGVCRIEHADPNIFIMEQGHTAAEAKKYCIRCTVRDECADYARRTRSVGVYGGKLFTVRQSQPVELIPVMMLQDARPKAVTVSERTTPAILDMYNPPQASNFRLPWE